MFITKKHISRRTILKGAGVNLALPFLSAMVPASTALAQTAANPKLRAGFFYIPHGAIMHNTKFGPEADRWTPSGSGANFKLNEINSPLEPLKKYVTSFGNLENAAAAGSVHVRNPATWLSATMPTGNNLATTLDQEMAKFISKDTPFPTMELASETTVQVAAGNGGPFTTLSFRDDHTPLPMEYNPRKVFLQLFGEGESSFGPADEHRQNGADGFGEAKPQAGEPGEQMVSIAPQARPARRVLLKHGQRGACGGGGAGRRSRGEHERAAGADEILDHVRRTGDIGAAASERFAECSHVKRNLAFDSEMFKRAAARWPGRRREDHLATAAGRRHSKSTRSGREPPQSAARVSPVARCQPAQHRPR